MEFSMNLKNLNDKKSVIEGKGLENVLNKYVLSIVTRIPKGKKWNKDDRESTRRDSTDLFHVVYKEYKNGIKS